MLPGYSIRPLSDADSITDLTDLLHRAYKRLLDMGLRYLATEQSEDVTRRRIVGHLIVFYNKRGYRYVDFTDATMPHYRSVILSKRIQQSSRD